MHDQQSLAKHFKFTAMKTMLFGISPRVNYDKNLSLVELKSKLKSWPGRFRHN